VNRNTWCHHTKALNKGKHAHTLILAYNNLSKRALSMHQSQMLALTASYCTATANNISQTDTPSQSCEGTGTLASNGFSNRRRPPHGTSKAQDARAQGQATAFTGAPADTTCALHRSTPRDDSSSPQPTERGPGYAPSSGLVNAGAEANAARKWRSAAISTPGARALNPPRLLRTESLSKLRDPEHELDEETFGEFGKLPVPRVPATPFGVLPPNPLRSPRDRARIKGSSRELEEHAGRRRSDRAR
jgi:hypothetical protein